MTSRRRRGSGARTRSIGTLLAAAGLAAACGRAPGAPDASFLLVTADSTHWVQVSRGQPAIRRSAMLLALSEGRFVELYVHDDDRSYFDAVLVGQRIYSRDLISGDSAVVWSDSVVAAIAEDYGRAHPAERRLLPDEDTAEEPSMQATGDTELFGADGSFLSFEFHRDVDVDGATVRDQHVTFRGVIDIRSASRVGLSVLLDTTEARRVLTAARQSLLAAKDSVQRARDERSRRALQSIAGFELDTNSFVLSTMDGRLAISFLVPGRGATADGLALPLPPIGVSSPPWWDALAATRPAVVSGNESAWTDSSYDVVTRLDVAKEESEVTVRTEGLSVRAGRVAGVVERVYRLSSAPNDEHARALRHAFDEAQLLSGETRVAALGAPAAPRARASRRHPPLIWTPNHREIPKRLSPT